MAEVLAMDLEIEIAIHHGSGALTLEAYAKIAVKAITCGQKEFR